jgi:hypothetical protein
MDLHYPEAWPTMDVAVRVNGMKLPINPEDGRIELEDGFIEKIANYCDLRLEVAGNESNIPFLVDRERDDKPIRLCRDRFGYREIQVRHAKGKEGHYKTDPRYNNIRLLSLDYDPTPPSPDYSPTLVVFMVAVISQGGNLFVTCDPTLEFGKDPDENVWTCHTEWKSLDSKIFEITRRKVVQVDQEPPDFCDQGKTGRVFWFDPSRGVGLAWVWYEGEKVEASVYWAEIQRPGRRAFLVPKESISYKGVRIKRNPSGRKSKFKLELTGVSVI